MPRHQPQPHPEYAPRRQAPAVPGNRPRPARKRCATQQAGHPQNTRQRHCSQAPTGHAPTDNHAHQRPQPYVKHATAIGPPAVRRKRHATDPDTHTIIGPTAPRIHATQQGPDLNKNTPAQQEPNRARTQNVPQRNQGTHRTPHATAPSRKRNRPQQHTENAPQQASATRSSGRKTLLTRSGPIYLSQPDVLFFVPIFCTNFFAKRNFIKWGGKPIYRNIYKIKVNLVNFVR